MDGFPFRHGYLRGNYFDKQYRVFTVIASVFADQATAVMFVKITCGHDQLTVNIQKTNKDDQNPPIRAYERDLFILVSQTSLFPKKSATLTDGSKESSVECIN